jgi:O-antigen/teichoic acid export membrane protein
MGLTIKKQAARFAVITIIAASTHIILQLLLVPRYGYIASAVSTLIGYSLFFVLQTLASKPHLTWHFPFSTLRNTAIASILMGLAAWGIYGLSGRGSSASFIYLFLSIIVAVPIYSACLWLFGEVKAEEKLVIFQFFQKVKGGHHG